MQPLRQVRSQIRTPNIMRSIRIIFFSLVSYNTIVLAQTGPIPKVLQVAPAQEVEPQVKASDEQVKRWTRGAAEKAVQTIGRETSLKVVHSSPPTVLAFAVVADDRPMVVEYCLVGLQALDSEESRKSVLLFLSRDPYSLVDSIEWSTDVDGGFAFDGSKLRSDVSIMSSVTETAIWEFWKEHLTAGSTSVGMKPLLVVELHESAAVFATATEKGR